MSGALSGGVVAVVLAASVGLAPPAFAAAGPRLSAPGLVTTATVSTQDALTAAQARLTAANKTIGQVAARLQDGTARWQAGVDGFAASQTRTVLAEQAAEEALADAGRSQQVLNDTVASLYRSPQMPAALLVLSGGVNRAQDVVDAVITLERVRGRQQAALGGALTQRENARRVAGQAEGLRDADAGRARALAAELAGLQSLAERTNEQVQAASADVDRLQAQLDAERAAETRRRQVDEAARLARLGEGQSTQPWLAAPAPAAGSTYGCAGRSTAGYANGNVPRSALCPLRYAPGHVLRADAAAAYNALTDAYLNAVGAPICITDSYRDYATQVRLFATKPSLAAVPGTSNHGWGVAVDLCGGIQDYGTPAYMWMKANAPRFGWIHPAWAEPGGSRQEPWHWEFTG